MTDRHRDGQHYLLKRTEWNDDGKQVVKKSFKILVSSLQIESYNILLQLLEAAVVQNQN